MNTEAMAYQEGKMLDYTPVAAKLAGQMVQSGGRAGLCVADIEAGVQGAIQVAEVAKIVKAQVAGSAGQTVGWDEDGNPYGGTAGTGALVTDLGAADFLVGSLIDDMEATDTVGYVELNKFMPNAPEYSQTIIWVSKLGKDTNEGTFASPLLTITAALAAAAADTVIMVMPGEYAEADITWPNYSGIQLRGAFGGVTIVQATGAATSIITVSPTSTASWSGTIANVGIESDYTGGKCLTILNANMTATKKINFYLDNVDLSCKAATDSSLIVTNTVASGAIRVYCTGNYPIWEAIVTFTTLNAGDRIRIYNHRLIGAVTMSGSVANAEITLISCATPTVTCATAALNNVNCWHESDADPNVYTAYANAYDT